MQIGVSASEIKSSKKADDRGRVTLGSEFAGKTVTVAVLEAEDDVEEHEELTGHDVEYGQID